MRVSVEAPSGAYVKATDGTTLNGALATVDYEFMLDEYGKYIVNYSYFDQNRNEVTAMYYIHVVDVYAPTITLSNGYGENTRVLVDVGDKVKIADYAVSDNLNAESELRTRVYVLHANGELLEITDGRFIATDRGDYIVYYYCWDTDNNYTVVKYYVRAE